MNNEYYEILFCLMVESFMLHEDDRGEFIRTSLKNGYIPKSYYGIYDDEDEEDEDTVKVKKIRVKERATIICMLCKDPIPNKFRQSVSTRCSSCNNKYRMELYYKNKNK